MNSASTVAMKTAVGFGVSGTPLVDGILERGSGVRVATNSGRWLIDLFAGAGICSLGHGHPRYISGVSKQLERLCVARGETNARAALVERLDRCLPPGLNRLGFFSTGAEAIEFALRLCCEATEASDVIVCAGAFHGRTPGAALASDPCFAGRSADPPNIHRLPFPSGDDLAELEGAATALRETSQPGQMAAVVVEPIQGTAGNRIPVPGFLELLRGLADDLGAALVCDEVITGFGRTGRLFRAEEEGVEADVLVTGKGMANGMPCSMVATRAELAEASGLEPTLTSTSFGGNPLSMAAADTTLAVILDEGLIGNSAAVGRYWMHLLDERLASLPIVSRIRGAGLLIGIEMSPDVFSPRLDRHSIALAMATEGVLVGMGGNAIRLNPPLVFSADDAQTATAVIARALRRLERTARHENQTSR
jgi:4-aminobutyrate aminotransferase-like enzyme